MLLPIKISRHLREQQRPPLGQHPQLSDSLLCEDLNDQLMLVERESKEVCKGCLQTINKYQYGRYDYNRI